MTGKKMEEKEWIRHTGYPGGIRVTTISKLMATNPSDVIMRAVKGMLPKNKLRQVRLDRLKVFAAEGETVYDRNAHKDYRLD
ncbi:Ribosomal protein L13 [Perkinsus sp. BL_2016]|nr:Ribosomal protein L13 [Perkinsus sp. BL_2016]